MTVFRYFLLITVLTLGTLCSQVFEGKQLVKASLVADTTAIVPGQSFEVGLILEMQPKWHTYWEYSGDAGIPTKIEWTLPEGFGTGPIQWPLPQQELEPGDIEVYAYGDQVLLITSVVAPKDLAQKSVTLLAKASWLVCAEICIPGNAEVEITLPVAKVSQAANIDLFAKFRSQLPSADPAPFPIEWTKSGNQLTAKISNLGAATQVQFYPLPSANQQVGHPAGGSVSNGQTTITIEATSPLRGVLVVVTNGERKAWTTSSSESSAAPGPDKTTDSKTPAPVPLWLQLLYGFIGGLILNLMPCVLPVISLKIFGFIKQSGDDRGKILRHGLAFVAGIFVWFLGLAILVIALKTAGHEVTWAFQFQNPWFNVAISSLVFVFALNLFGVFEIILPGKAATALDAAGARDGYAGSFSQGIFATLLATPCTAPYLGSALGYAFAQSSGIILLMFFFVAAGMAAPYFLLSAQPGWMKFLPKPGLWMERMRQFMGFPLMATLLWLLYILGNQRGIDGVLCLSAFLLCLAVCCWIYGAFCDFRSTPRARTVSLLLIILIAVGGGWYFLGKQFANIVPPSTKEVATADGIPWVPFSQATLDAELAAGKTVFVDFTADWCITCKFNERTAINVPAVRAAFKESGIVPMRADWTNANPEITAALKKFNRVGVPFYVIYRAGETSSPIVLPEFLTESIVLEALKKAQ